MLLFLAYFKFSSQMMVIKLCDDDDARITRGTLEIIIVDTIIGVAIWNCRVVAFVFFHHITVMKIRYDDAHSLV